MRQAEERFLRAALAENGMEISAGDVSENGMEISAGDVSVSAPVKIASERFLSAALAEGGQSVSVGTLGPIHWGHSWLLVSRRAKNIASNTIRFRVMSSAAVMLILVGLSFSILALKSQISELRIQLYGQKTEFATNQGISVDRFRKDLEGLIEKRLADQKTELISNQESSDQKIRKDLEGLVVTYKSEVERRFVDQKTDLANNRDVLVKELKEMLEGQKIVPEETIKKFKDYETRIASSESEIKSLKLHVMSLDSKGRVPSERESSSSHTVAQADSAALQRKDYGRMSKASKATDEERLLLLEAQEMRLSVPSEVVRFKKYIESFSSSKAAPVLGTLLRWSEIALDATALDSTNPENTQKDPLSLPGPPSFFGEQYGPPRTSRVMAIVHLAMFEAVNTISHEYQSYKDIQGRINKRVGLPPAEIAKASKNRAIVAAAYQTLVMLYPKKKNFFDNALDVSLVDYPNSSESSVVVGALVGLEAANAVLALRYFDGSELPDLSSADFDSGNPLRWHQDPISKATSALGGNWSRLKPFVIASGDAFRTNYLPGPPAPGTPEYIEAYKMTKRLGGDPNVVEDGERVSTKTDRTGAKTPDKPTPPHNKDETFIGSFWAYDGSAYIGSSPRLYNMIATSIALKEKPIVTVEEFSFYLAYINVTLADAAIVAWDGKFHYLFPRPITLLRDVKADDTPEGARDPFWTPLGAQATNGVASTRNITPPFPSYPSEHAVFGGALFQALQAYFKSVDFAFPNDGIAFDFISDEYNGKNSSPGNATPRERVVAHFDSFKEAEKANADSRIYLGVHWKFDVEDGINVGNAVARYTSENFVKPIPKK